MNHDEALLMVEGEIDAVNGAFEKWLKSGEINGDTAHDFASAFTAGWMGASDTLITEFTKLKEELLGARLLNNHARVEVLKNIIPNGESMARRVDDLIDEAIEDGRDLISQYNADTPREVIKVHGRKE